MTELKSWEELSELEQAQATYWDMHKDAYGVRPRGIDTSTWTLADFDAEFKVLGEAINREEVIRKEREAQAVVDFENRVASLMTLDNSRERVIAWLMDAESANGDFEYFAYTQNLPYQYFRKTA
tara:strand:- start:3 stop:374 length:372 start_codon:yes stop_codon:yes gene_type:complete